MMSLTKKEQSICVKFCFENDFSAIETFKMIKVAFPNDHLPQKKIFEIFQKHLDRIKKTPEVNDFDEDDVVIICDDDENNSNKDGKNDNADNNSVTSNEISPTDYMNKILQVRSILKSQENMTVQNIAEKIDISFDECTRILIHLMKKDPFF